MRDPEAGLAFAESPVGRQQCSQQCWVVLLLAAFLAVAMVGWPFPSSYSMLLVVLGMFLLHLTALEAVS